MCDAVTPLTPGVRRRADAAHQDQSNDPAVVKLVETRSADRAEAAR